MSVERFSPNGMKQGMPFDHVAVGTGARQVHIAGQTATDSDGNLVGEGNLTEQVSQAFRNVATGLTAAGATFEDVVRFTFFIARWETEQHDDFLAGIAAVADELGIPDPLPPCTLIGVESLFTPEVLFEVEATAVID